MERELRKTFKEFDKELKNHMREAEKAWAMTKGILYKGEFTFASIKITNGALSLLGEKLSKIGTTLAFKAEIKALEQGKIQIDKKTMKTVLGHLEVQSEGE